MRKYDLISAISEETAREVARNDGNWKKYLNTASGLYKYPFKDQLLIYAQRPDATACASIEIWNEKMHCWVNKGAKGIALIDEEGSPYTGLRYVFDISDVHKARRIGRFPQLWEMKEEHQEAVIDRLEQIYGDTNKETGFVDRIREIASRIAEDCYQELASDMEYLKEGSFLEEFDELNIGLRIRETLADSIAYTVLKRCGMDENELSKKIEFPYIHEFNTVGTLSHIGNNVSDLSKPVLMEIGKAVGTYDRENVRNAEAKNLDEKGLENTSDTRYNALKRESERQDGQSITQTGNIAERGNNDEFDIRKERGLHDPDVADGRAAGGDIDQVRADAEELLTGTQEGSLHRTSLERKTERTPSDHSGTGRAENGASNQTDDKAGGRNGETQSRESDALGTEDEQHQAVGRGNRSDGTGIQSVNEEKTYQQLSLFPSIEEQIGTIEAAQAGEKYTMPAAFSLPQEQLEAILRTGGGRDNSRSRIYARYQQGKTPEEMAEKAMHKEQEKPEHGVRIEYKETIEASEIDKSGASNYHISFNEAENVGKGFAPKEKFRQNVEAIRTLEKIEGEQRIATPEEQEILAKYVGWGGLADAFDETKVNWANEYQELKSLLSPEEYSSARESTLNAHYTSPVIIQAIYDAVGRMGFTKGNVLDPAVGIGNFYGCLPEEMQGSRLYGAELDGLTGRIAKQLYPHADIRITGFENTNYPNDFFDVAVGNVPFGQYKVSDKAYDKHNFLIHDYFFAKTLDKVRPGGVVAFVTSKGTMDKKSPEVRKYLAQRAELLGAVRLPNTAFKENAGTEVTSDILFLKKRDRVLDIEPDWVHLTEKDGIVMNQYFADHPEMVLGKMEMVSGAHGMISACLPDNSIPLSVQLKNALSHVEGSIEQADFNEIDDDLARENIPADPNVKNYSYTLVDNKVYYRENSIMKPVDMSDSMQERIRGMVGIRNCTQELIGLQLEEYPDSSIKEKQAELNSLYDNFSEKYGLISSQTNKRAFNQDASYCLLCSLEKLDDEGNFIGKADMFTKRTIKKQEVVTSVDTASEALAVSLGEKAKVDLDYMAELAGKDADTIKEELIGVIFQNPVTDKWETADEYLSGNVRDKLETAKVFAEKNPEYVVNVQALTQIQPKELDASEIEVRIGATWIDPKYIEDFMHDTFETPQHLLSRNVMGIQYSDVTGQWNVKGKNADYGNSLVNMTYGTSRRNAYQILEDSLNLKDSRVYDTIVEDGKEKRVLNKKETTIASQKQEAIREAFKDWIFRDPERRQDLVEKYNKLFNSTRPREYNGDHLKFPGMTPDIELKPHQKNAVAHVLYGDNTLLAHCVGAGKTFEMTAAAMESKRLGLCQKSLFVVPNHLTEQWASDFLRLYPGANILAATKKDFEPANRKKFCSRIATGDYDAVIIGHSQFEKIPLSQERQAALIERQIDEIELAIAQAKADNGERYTIKQMEKSRKALETRLEKLNDTSRKDNVVTFEQLGVDRLFVDESHNYKNLFLYTKMRNVAGIAQSEAQKSSDMFAKCQYLDELTGGKGVTFATGTPISNSMTELYTNMRYLQYDTLQKLGLGHFDSWASSFGETQTAIELAPEGTGYRAKTRFAKFFNLPELIALFKESADIQTPDMLKLPVPDAEYENVVLKPSEYQQDMVSSLADRAEAVRDRKVDATVDNMLKITNDGRKLALDQRLINDMLPDSENSKAATCVSKAFEIWEQTKEQKSTQLIFCDLSTPKGDGTFNVYEDIKNKLVEKGVPPEEIAFIHDANTEQRKAELFGKVRSGQVRFLLGSTQKMGAGTNVQDRLIALHHLDVPWRPSDIEQQEGRILRQGNFNPKVKIFRYVTEGTFDSYSWQLIENKQKFIGQIMTSKSPVRSCEDVDEAALTYAEVKALATGNPYIKEKMDLDIQVSKLKLMKANHTSQKYRLEDNITQHYPQQIAMLKARIGGLETDIQTAKANLPTDKEHFFMKVADKTYTDKKEAGSAIVEMCREIKTVGTSTFIGEYAGFKMAVSFDSFNSKFVMSLKGHLSYNLEIGSDPLGNIARINHALESMTKEFANAKVQLENVERQLDTAKTEVTKPFAQEAELAKKLERLTELNALLNMDEKNNDLEKRGEQMDDNTWLEMWKNDGKPEVKEDNVKKDIILVDVVHCDEHRYFMFEDIGLEEIKEQLRHTDKPMVDLTGKHLILPDFAGLEQSDEVSLSLTVNMDDRTIKVYETNNIPEDLRTDDNTPIETFPMDEYLNGKKIPETNRSSVLERLHQNQSKLQNVNSSGKEPINRNHETVK